MSCGLPGLHLRGTESCFQRCDFDKVSVLVIIQSGVKRKWGGQTGANRESEVNDILDDRDEEEVFRVSRGGERIFADKTGVRARHVTSSMCTNRCQSLFFCISGVSRNNSDIFT